MSHAVQVWIPEIAQRARFDDERPWLSALKLKEQALWDNVRTLGTQTRHHLSEQATYIQSDVLRWLAELPANSIHAVVTDPPYGMIEYDVKNHAKLRKGRAECGVFHRALTARSENRYLVYRADKGGDSQSPRVLQLSGLRTTESSRAGRPRFYCFESPAFHDNFHALIESGFEKRGEIIRLVQTLRGGDRPKGAEEEFPDVTLCRGRAGSPGASSASHLIAPVAENLREWGTGGLQRLGDEEPFKDVIPCSPTRSPERDFAPHPSLKPQRFLRNSFELPFLLELG